MQRVKGNHGVAMFDERYPKFKKVELHPDFSKHLWMVTLVDDIVHGVSFGDLRGWLDRYAR